VSVLRLSGKAPASEARDGVTSTRDSSHSDPDDVRRDACTASVTADRGHRGALAVLPGDLSYTPRPKLLHTLIVVPVGVTRTPRRSPLEPGLEQQTILWNDSPGRAFAALRPDGERSARRLPRLAPFPEALYARRAAENADQLEASSGVVRVVARTGAHPAWLSGGKEWTSLGG
jgi:hypothetical protein